MTDLLPNGTAPVTDSTQIITLVGNLTNWRENFKDNTRRMKVLHGHAKIHAFLDRFKVKPNQ